MEPSFAEVQYLLMSILVLWLIVVHSHRKNFVFQPFFFYLTISPVSFFASNLSVLALISPHRILPFPHTCFSLSDRFHKLSNSRRLKVTFFYSILFPLFTFPLYFHWLPCFFLIYPSFFFRYFTSISFHEINLFDTFLLSFLSSLVSCFVSSGFSFILLSFFLALF